MEKLANNILSIYSDKNFLDRYYNEALPYLNNFNCMDLKSIFAFVKENIIYSPDLGNKQYLHSFKKFLIGGKGNCKDYSLFWYAITRYFLIPHCKFIFCGNYKDHPTHVYFSANGVCLDNCLNEVGEKESTLYEWVIDLN